MNIKSLVLCVFAFIYFSNLNAQNDLDRAQQKWISYLNAGKPELAAEMYLPNGHLMMDGELVTGQAEIAKLLNDLVHPELNTDYGNHYKHTDKAYFHLHNIESPEGKWQSTIAWKNIDGVWMKELEIIHLSMSGVHDDSAILEAREKWVDFSNAHDHKKLVGLLYTEDAWYINNGVSYQGHEAISKKYAYMSRPNWHIELTRAGLEHISAGLVMETGQYESNGIGHYIILWRKTGHHYNVALDFNF